MHILDALAYFAQDLHLNLMIRKDSFFFLR